ncbi:ABC transporter ATP-binding protein [Nocardioides sp.]|nr:ABC transporter ATP-binding protein [Nocardioides sp.]
MRTRAYRFELNSSRVAVGAPLLEVADVSLRFGGIRALSEVSFTVRQGDIHAVIGPNGAGKSSMLNCVSGLYRPQRGTIALHSVTEADEERTHDLVARKPHQIARLGVARSFQNIELFGHLTLLENLMLGRHSHMRQSVLAGMAWFGPARRQEIEHREFVEEVIDLLQLQAFRHAHVGSLAYGVQKRVELGRALCIEPALLLLDEPMAGMNAEEKEDMARFILDVSELRGVTTMLIEHDMGVVMDLSDRITVLDFGKVIGDGRPDEISANEDVVKAYLGEEL